MVIFSRGMGLRNCGCKGALESVGANRAPLFSMLSEAIGQLQGFLWTLVLIEWIVLTLFPR